MSKTTKDRYIGLHVTDAQYRAISEEAEREHESTASFVRRNILKLVERRKAERQPQPA